ncbi:heavy metal translocating P-type ATPase [Corynebacterium crudilactis]|uniref:Cadmium-translocating P-type ATPase n=1 Tax=Corynebacterium crudilactis TaxID=1652495 RepID=A0A172QRA1_9CORY|nr:heavy metal translocating P-type ATPase [Corynebacterium crudilactis]ANE03190.1 cadmium-translocating P-type ATPase [Corynebacterium crudilactis]
MDAKLKAPNPWLLFIRSTDGMITVAALIAIAVHLILWLAVGAEEIDKNWPLIAIVVIGGIPLMWDVVKSAIKTRGGADTLAAVSIITSVLLGEWLVAAIIVLMLSGGEALEGAASRRASGTLDALARRAPSTAHRLLGSSLLDGGMEEIAVADIAIGDVMAVLPHELCPVDGEVVEGHGTMDESYLTGEPYVVSKSKGSQAMSGAVNGDTPLTIVATKRAHDSRYAQIVGVLHEAEDNRPEMRRMADRLGAWYTVIALALGGVGWIISGDPLRFLAVVVVATPCPLLIAVPVAIIGAISLAARRGIIVKNPGMLENASEVKTVMFDKTGTLTYGRPVITDIHTAPGFEEDQVLALAASVERYSRHPLAEAIREGAQTRELNLPDVVEVSERPGQGLTGMVGGHLIRITNRRSALEIDPDSGNHIPVTSSGMESVVLVDGNYAALIRLRDEPRASAGEFIAHLPRKHKVDKLMIISGDRGSEVRYLADKVGIDEVHAEASPEKKLEIVKKHNERGATMFLGDGINDAPAMAVATVGVAMGANSDVTSEAADAVILDSSLERLDDLIHISARMRRIALQSAGGGMVLSIIGMIFAVFGVLTPLMGAIVQEVIDVLAILNSARVALPKGSISDFDTPNKSS